MLTGEPRREPKAAVITKDARFIDISPVPLLASG
jgi:hypothetical protein